jgi:serine phosphatase RsbU (regulator of sigma subunit)
VSAYRSARRRGFDLSETYLEADSTISQQAADRHVTAVLAELDVADGRLRWVNAGHPAPLLLREGRVVSALEAHPQTPLGMGFTVGPVPVSEVGLQPGDMVLLYTDGLSEARLPDGTFFGVERLAEFIERQAAAGFPAPETLRRLRHAVLAHQHGRLQDDASALLVEWRRGTERSMLPPTTE